VVVNHGVKKELVVQEQVQIVHLYGKVVVSFLVQNQKITLKLNKKERQLALQTLLYNKKNNILIIDNLENEISEPKTKTFLKICKDCSINLESKIISNCFKKNNAIKISQHKILKMLN
jgi:ribosomal protein L4